MLLGSQRKNRDQQSRKHLETMAVTEHAENLGAAVRVLQNKSHCGNVGLAHPEARHALPSFVLKSPDDRSHGISENRDGARIRHGCLFPFNFTP